MEIKEILAKIEEIKGKLIIDKDQLHFECIQQPALYAEVRELLTLVREEKDAAKNDITLKAAALSMQIRNAPEAFNIDKVTEKAIESALITHPEYQQAIADSTKLNTIYELLLGLKDALEQRKSMIRELVSLFVHEYYSTKTDLSATSARDLDKVEEDELESRHFE